MLFICVCVGCQMVVAACIRNVVVMCSAVPKTKWKTHQFNITTSTWRNGQIQQSLGFRATRYTHIVYCIRACASRLSSSVFCLIFNAQRIQQRTTIYTIIPFLIVVVVVHCLHAGSASCRNECAWLCVFVCVNHDCLDMESHCSCEHKNRKLYSVFRFVPAEQFDILCVLCLCMCVCVCLPVAVVCECVWVW